MAISAEERARWRAIVADRMGTGLIHEHVGRLLDALDAADAMARALERYSREYDWLPREAGAALTAYRQHVAPPEGTDGR